MDVQPRSGIKVDMSANRRLRLVTPTADVVNCDDEAAAFWIAIQQHSGKVEAAVTMLTSLWHTDRAAVEEQAHRCIDRWRAAGLLDVTPARSGLTPG